MKTKVNEISIKYQGNFKISQAPKISSSVNAAGAPSRCGSAIYLVKRPYIYTSSMTNGKNNNKTNVNIEI